MENRIRKFLEFNGKNVYFTLVEGTWYIAIKPICEALKVDYVRQFKNLKEDKILGQPLSEQTIVAADGRLRKMICLPEFFLYGWLLKINSPSKGLQVFQWKCYELLYNYFHNTFMQRNRFLRDKVHAENELEAIEKELMKTEDFIKWKGLKSKRTFAKKALDKLDKDLITPQIAIFEN